MPRTSTLLAAAFTLVLGAAPAFAGEGRGNPYDVDVLAGRTIAVGSGQLNGNLGAERPYDPSGLPGTGLMLSAELLPINGSNGVVQTANSAPTDFSDGTVQFAQARSIQAWHTSQFRRATLVAAQPSGATPQG